MKTCKKCKVERLSSLFYKEPRNNDGLAGTCRYCVNKLTEENKGRYADWDEQRAVISKRYYAKNSTFIKLKNKLYGRLNVEKMSAKNKVYRAKLKGTLSLDTCRVCGSTRTECHHKDYSKPLDVVWLCHKCHMGLHKGSICI